MRFLCFFITHHLASPGWLLVGHIIPLISEEGWYRIVFVYKFKHLSIDIDWLMFENGCKRKLYGTREGYKREKRD